MQTGLMGTTMTSTWDPELDGLVPEVRAMNEVLRSFMAAVPSFATPEGLVQLRSGANPLAGPPCPWAIERRVPGPPGCDHEVPIRVLVPPESTSPRGVYLDLHGGGWCIGSAASGDQHNAAIAESADVVVVSVDYRLAPEDPWPAGADDCEAATRWVLEHAPSEWGTDRLVIGGGSAGAHLAAVTLLRLHETDGVDDAIAGANLVFGPYDLGLTPSQRASDDALVIPLDVLEACYTHTFVGLDREARRHPTISPLYADLTRFPPTLLTVGTEDPLLDDSLFFAHRLRTAGVEVELAVYPECPHGFPAFPSEMARVANERIGAWISARFDT